MSKPETKSTYTPTYRDELAIIRHFVDVLEQRLGGREGKRRVNINPLDWCQLGVLGPVKREVVTLDYEADVPESAEVDNEDSERAGPKTAVPTGSGSASSVSAQPTADPEADETASTAPDRAYGGEATRRPPSALGFELLVEPNVEGFVDLVVEAEFCVFTRHLPTYAEQASVTDDGVVVKDSPIAEVTQRSDISVPEVRFRIPATRRGNFADAGACQAALDAALGTAFGQPDAMPNWPGARPKVEERALTSGETTFGAFIGQLRSGHDMDNWRMQARVEVRAWPRSDGKIRVGCYLKNETVAEGPAYKDAFRIIGDARLKARLEKGTLAPSEILPVSRDYQYDRRVWAVGHNTSVVVAEDRRSLKTASLAGFDQIRIVTKDQPAARFSDLDAKPFDTLDGIFEAMQSFAKDWESRIVDTNELSLDSNALSECAKDLEGFRAEIGRFAAGIAALQADSRLLIAFRAMNRAFGRLALGYDSWRLFQLVFIVTQLPALAVRESIVSGEYPPGQKHSWADILDWGDVLWFRTGSGKTEAYLGLTCCAILYDRLRGKAFGITAWLRFPLRMLSVQQLQRAMRVIWEAEQERKALLGEAAKNSDPLRLGYFVGGTTTPNSVSEETLNRYKKPEEAERLRVIPDCPACGGRGTVQVQTNEAAMCFEHVCSVCNAHLPLDVSDDEIYRHLPALIVGTIDKMASVGHQVKYGMLWGGARWLCPKHGYSFGDYCGVFGCEISKKKTNRKPVSPYDPSPALHIQDELHLLQEELGAFAGHYETLVRHCEQDLSGRPAKVVAATATIEGFEHQVRHVYGVKDARRFPGRGYDRFTSFYSEPDWDSDSSPKIARVFAAFRSASMHQADAAAFCTEVMQAEIDRLISNPHEALAFLHDASIEDDVRALMRYYTTTLNYVGSLARGSRVCQKLEDAAPKLRPGTEREMTVEYHSSRSSGAEVAELVHKVENPPQWEDPQFLDAVVATNMISHGVDLERINVITMDGVPEETAEYIQASSRSGRKHVGLVVVVLPTYSLRASSIYHRFREYHEHLDRMVSPVPVNRFAKHAARRTLPGITLGLLYGKYVAQTSNQNAKQRHEALRLIDSVGVDRFLEELKNAYALGEEVYDQRLERGLEAALKDEFGRVYGSMYGSHEKYVKDAVRPMPMTSLRDVEVGIPFQPDTDWRVLQWLQKSRE